MRSQPLAIVFARAPEPGKVKTRLARGIGPEAACRIYRACLKRALTAARRWGGEARIASAGPADERWLEWRERGWAVHPQREGDLGERLAGALEEGLAPGERPALCVGSDVPGITPRHLRQAARALRAADAVVGPCVDGGYYLIGARRPCPGLFRGIAWSTGAVLEQTRGAARRAGLRLAELAPLRDVDTTEELRGGAGTTSVIVPTLNEEGRVAQCVREVWMLGVSEVIVADGGSEDATAERAREAGATVVVSPPGRGTQLAAGAAAATGQTLWFVHADCRLDPLALWEVGRALRDPEVVGGAFELAIDSPSPALRALAWSANLRSRWFGEPYGDQAMFVRRAAFDAFGGVPGWPLMEDVELARRMRRAGRVAIVPSPARASARRWRERGVLRTWLLTKRVRLAHRFGASPESLARLYRR